MPRTSIAIGEQQQSAIEIYVADPVFDDDEDRAPVVLTAEGRLEFDTDEGEIVATRLTDVLNGLDDVAEDRGRSAEDRHDARQLRDALTTLVRKVRKVSAAGRERRLAPPDRLRRVRALARENG